jgi:hypothetical protein
VSCAQEAGSLSRTRVICISLLHLQARVLKELAARRVQQVPCVLHSRSWQPISDPISLYVLLAGSCPALKELAAYR